MDTREAIRLIAKAIPRQAGTWADLGAGRGAFTRALAGLLAPRSRIYAVDRDPRAVAALKRWAARDAANVIPVLADFTGPFELPGLNGAPLDGMLLANALHFVRDAAVVLGRLTARLRPGGRAVFVEYDGRRPSRWVPYPIPVAQLPALVAAAGLSAPVVTGTRPSDFGGMLYSAAADRPCVGPAPIRGSSHSGRSRGPGVTHLRYRVIR